MTTDRSSGRVTLYKRLVNQTKPFWLQISFVFLLGLLATPLALLTPIPLKIAVDSVIGSKPIPRFLDILLPASMTNSSFGLLFFIACLQVFIVLLIRIQDLGTYILRTRTSEALIMNFRSQLFHHVQRLSLLFHDTRGTADSIYRIQNDASAIEWIIFDGIGTVVSSALMLVAMIYVISRINLVLALVALAVCPFVFFLGTSYDRIMSNRYDKSKELESRAFKFIHEVLGAIRVVKAYGREENEKERFVEYSRESAKARIHLAFAEGFIVLAVNLVTAVGAAFVLFIGIRNVKLGMLSLGEFLMVLTYLSQLYGPLETIGNRFANIQSSLASARRSFDILDERPDVTEKLNSRSLKRAVGTIEFVDVSFAYDGTNFALRNLSFIIPSGSRLGIMGTTGSGKTTLISLLTRFYDPTSGKILLDGVDLCDYKLADLRNQFAIVLQEPVLFSTSIAENLAYSRPEAREEEIINAAKLADAHEFIMRLPEGYRTQVGERGATLSGGERQRIALGRAFLKDAPILILDEPTSSVDLRTESEIIEAMERLIKGRTTILITHRLASLKNCDILLKIEGGQLVTVTSDASSTIKDLLISNTLT